MNGTSYEQGCEATGLPLGTPEAEVIEALRLELRDLRESFSVRRMALEGGTLDVRGEGSEAVKLLAGLFLGWLDEEHAPNCLEITAHAHDDRACLITISRVGPGVKGPLQIKAEAERDLEKARATNRRLHRRCQQAERGPPGLSRAEARRLGAEKHWPGEPEIHGP